MRSNTPCYYQYLPLRPKSKHPIPILPAPAHDRAAPTPSLCIVPKSVFGSLAPQDVRYLEFFVRGLQHQFSLSRIGDAALSKFCKHLAGPPFSYPTPCTCTICCHVSPRGKATRKSTYIHVCDVTGSRSILQQGAQEEYILEGLLGIAALARARQSASTQAPLYRHNSSYALKDANYRNALRHYDKAITKARQALEVTPPEFQVGVTLTSCILFFTFEFLQDNTSAVEAIGGAGIEALPRLLSESTPADIKSTVKAMYFLLRSNVFQSVFSPMYPTIRSRLLEITASESFQPPAGLGLEYSIREFTAVWWRFVTTMLNFTINPAASQDESTVPKTSRIPCLLAVLDTWKRTACNRAAVCRDPDSARLLRAIAMLAGRLSLTLQAQSVSSQTPEGRDYDEEFSLSLLDYSAILDFFKTSTKPQMDGAGNRSAEAFVINNESTLR